MSRDYRAKRLSRDEGIPYAEALRRVRAHDARRHTTGPHASSPVSSHVSEHDGHTTEETT